jgi:hypothetical protein
MDTLLLEHFAAVSKIAAVRQSRKRQQGVKMGYGDRNVYSSSFTGTALTSPQIPIGTSNFSIEYYGNAYGSGNGSSPLLINRATLGSIKNPSFFQVYGLRLGYNDLSWVTFSAPDGGNITTDSLNFNYSVPDLSAKFHLIITRQGRMINVYIDDMLIASKEQTEIKDFGSFALCILNSSDVGFTRVWNYALSSSEVATLYNNGDPAGHVLPAKLKDGEQRCIAEYLPQNLVADNNGLVSSWLDSAKQLPMNDEYIPPLLETAGGYDLTAEGAPEIIYKL